MTMLSRLVLQLITIADTSSLSTRAAVIYKIYKDVFFLGSSEIFVYRSQYLIDQYWQTRGRNIGEKGDKH